MMEDGSITITGGSFGGDVTEDEAVTDGNLLSSGSFTFEDSDATFHVPVIEPVGTPLGSLTANILDDSDGPGESGSVDWEYTLNNDAVQALNNGETINEQFMIRIIAGDGEEILQPVTVTVTGTNDVPVIDTVVGDFTGSVTEVADQTGSSQELTASGTVNFNDIDLNDAADEHSAAATNVSASGETDGLTLNSDALLALVSAQVTQSDSVSGDGSALWTFTSADSAFDYLDAGDTLTLEYELTISDSSEGSDTTTVTVTVTGSNDGPVAVADTNSVTEGPCAPAGETVMGNVLSNDTDADASSALTVTAAGTDAADNDLDGSASIVLSGTFGTLAIAPNGGYTYELNDTDSDTDALAFGETGSDVFTYQVSDNAEPPAVSTGTLTVTVNGGNDAVTTMVTTQLAALTEGTVDEDGNLSASDSFSFNDVDVSDTHIASVSAVASGVTSGAPADLTALFSTTVTSTDDAAGGTVDWDFDAADSAFDYLAADETVTLTYTVTVDDQNATGLSADDEGTISVDVNITITGTNDTPTIGNATIGNGIIETGASAPDAPEEMDGLLDDRIIRDISEIEEEEPAYIFEPGVSEITGDASDSGDGPGSNWTDLDLSEDANLVVISASFAGELLETEEMLPIPSAADQPITNILLPEEDIVEEFVIEGNFGTLFLQENGAYRYVLDNERPATEALDDGDEVSEVFDYIIANGEGEENSASSSITINIAGTNDAPRFVDPFLDDILWEGDFLPPKGEWEGDGPPPGWEGDGLDGEWIDDGPPPIRADIVEDDDASSQDAGPIFGSLFVQDVDAADTLSATAETPTILLNGSEILPDGLTIPGVLSSADALSLSFDSSDSASGTVRELSYTYDPEAADLDFLNEGDILTISYPVTLNDGSIDGETSNIIITIAGQNDAPAVMNDSTTATEDSGSAVTGSVAINDSDADFGDTLSFALDEEVDGLTISENGDFSYDTANDEAQSIAQGQTVDIVANYTATDDLEATGEATLTIAVTGVNDDVSFTSENASAALTEGNVAAPPPPPPPPPPEMGLMAPELSALDGIGEAAYSETVPVLEASGSLNFNDVDIADTHVVDTTFAATGITTGLAQEAADFLNILVNSTAEVSTGSVDWNFSAPDSAFDYLAEGEVVTLTYTLTIDDLNSFGLSADALGTDSRTVTITVTGTNDLPDVQALTSAIDEDGDSVTISPVFTDLDLSDTHIVTINDEETSGTVSINGDGDFVYSPNGQFEGLAEGESTTDTFTYTVDDGGGETVTETVTVTINGNNDAPIITAGIVTGEFTEPEGTTGPIIIESEDEYSGVDLPGVGGLVALIDEEGTVPEPSLTGSFEIADADVNGSTTLSAGFASFTSNFSGRTALNEAQQNALLAGLALGDIHGNDGTVNWTYEVGNETIDFIREGEVLTVNLEVTVDDNSGADNATATQIISITINGTNDEIMAAGGDAIVDLEGAITENEGDASDTGVLTFVDADFSNHAVLSSREGGTISGGTFTASVTDSALTDGEGQVTWSYSIDPAAIEFLAEGETVTESFTVRTIDTASDELVQTVTITITGTNDAPTIGNATVGNGIIEAGVTLPDEPEDLGEIFGATEIRDFGVFEGPVSVFVPGVSEITGDVSDSGEGAGSNWVDVDTSEDADLVITEASFAGEPIETEEMDLGDLVSLEAVAIYDDAPGKEDDIIVQGNFGTLFLQPDGQYRYVLDNEREATQALDEGDMVSEVFNYTVSNGEGEENSASSTITINITGTNDGPIANSDVVDVAEEAGIITGNVGENDVDPDESSQLTFILEPTVFVDRRDEGDGDPGGFGPPGFTLNSDGSYSFDANDEAFDFLAEGETAQLNVSYRVTDQFGIASVATITFNITGVNDAPDLTADAATLTENEGGVFDVLLNDSDVDSGSSITLDEISLGDVTGLGELSEEELAGIAANFSIDGDNIVFAPFSGYDDETIYDRIDVNETATIQINYLATDELGAESTSTFTLTINGVSEDLPGTTMTDSITGTDVGEDINGFAGDDVIDGAGGNDEIFGANGNDIIIGGDGDDILFGGTGDDEISGNDGDDELFGGGGADELSGGNGNDLLNGGAGNDQLSGGADQDILIGGAGIDILAGNEGDDIYLINSLDDILIELANEGTDEVRTTVDFTLGANFENLRLQGPSRNGDGNELDNLIIAGAGNHNINGFGGNDNLRSGAGNDVVNGGDGDDFLFGGQGFDELNGGADNDVLRGDGNGDVLNGDGGDDRLFGGSGQDILNGGDDNDILRGEIQNDTLNGDAGNDVLFGGLNNDILFGGIGNDILNGDEGRDFLTGGEGADVFNFNDGHFSGTTAFNTDRIFDFSQAQGDIINLGQVDAIAGDSSSSFDFIGTDAFSGTAGELRVETVGPNTLITGDTDGDGTADFGIRLDGQIALTQDDFVL